MVRCPACGNENPPEYPPEEYPFCIECGAQLGPFRPGPMPPQQQDPYGRSPAGPYGGGQYGGPPPGNPYGAPPPAGPYGGQPQDPYARPPADPYGGGQPGGPYPGGPGPGPGYGGPPPQYGPGPQQPYGGREDTPQLPAGPAGAKLVLESGVGKVEYPLDAPVVTIGRSRSNDISLEDARVSRHHARVVRDDRGYLIEDLNSRNGTRVDDRAVRDSAPLTDGAVVRIGDAVFRFTMTPGFGPGAHLQPAAPPGPTPWGGPNVGSPGGGVPAGPVAPVLFMSPWNPLQCPNCQGLRTMIQIVYGPAAATPGAQAAARRGEIILGEGPVRPDAPNAECRGCGTRVRIVQSGS